MQNQQDIDLIIRLIGRILGDGKEVTADSPLIGGHGINSMSLVELCLALEDEASGGGFVFDWTSDAAMSTSRGMFRTVASLAEEYARQRNLQQ